MEVLCQTGPDYADYSKCQIPYGQPWAGGQSSCAPCPSCPQLTIKAYPDKPTAQVRRMRLVSERARERSVCACL